MEDKEPTVTIVDAVMGTGKSTWIIEQIIKNHRGKYVVVLPLLTEVERYREALRQHRAVFAPDPEEIDSPTIQTKLDAFKAGLQAGEGVIITTHSLFSLWDAECFDHITKHGYICILDETVDLVQETEISKHDYQMLLNCGYLKEEKYKDNENLKCISSTAKTKEYNGEFSRFIKHALLNNLVMVNGKMCIRTVKPESITAFKHCYVLTYMYPGSQMDCWFKLYGVDVEIKTLLRSTFGDLHLANHPGIYSGKQFADLIHLEKTPKLLSRGPRGGRRRGIDLSTADFDNMDKPRLEQLQRNLDNFSRYKTDKFVKDVVCDDQERHLGHYLMWSTKKDMKPKLEGKLRFKSYPDIFVPHNIRATNDYSHKACLAYMTAPILRVPISRFFESCGLNFNGELYMLSTLLQWVWRSRIRNHLEILLYIPSEPLRQLFCQWIKGEVVVRV